MKLHTLSPSKGSIKNNDRVGRGQGTGGGGTAKRGHKGAKSRSGYSKKRGFEGGQMPLQRRIPKTGFKNFARVEYAPINIDRLIDLSVKYNTTTFTIQDLHNYQVISKFDKVKLLGNVETCNVKLTIECHAASTNAKSIVENAGGTVTIL